MVVQNRLGEVFGLVSRPLCAAPGTRKGTKGTGGGGLAPSAAAWTDASASAPVALGFRHPDCPQGPREPPP